MPASHPPTVRPADGLTVLGTVLLLLAPATPALAQAQAPYVPPPGDAWERREPRAAGFDPARLQEAVDFALANAYPLTPTLAAPLPNEPYPEIIGPVKPWEPSGLILRHGYLVAEWGDTRRVDVSFSVAKSYLATVAGLAFDRGLIPDVDRPVRELVRDGGFDSEHNRPITWRHLFTQTSEWEGTLWDKPDRADRRLGYDRTLNAPGTTWEYNDVRVNRLALSLLRVWQRPLPEVLKEFVMDPIGASDTWTWHGYYNSYVELDGRRVQSVSGGTHWGGGIWMATRDHARLGLLMLRRGAWGDRQLLSERWLAMSLEPTPLRTDYGFLWWLNRDPARHRYANASAASFFALGSGGNMIWVDPSNDLVVVTRWVQPARLNDFIGRVMAALEAR